MRILLSFLILISFCQGETLPVSNPVSDFYSGDTGYPAWTDGIKWKNVINMKSYNKGKTEFERFESARDSLVEKGGGVLYYPGGTYDFSKGPFDGPDGRGLMLRSGVIIRGEAPSGKPLAIKDNFELPTKFVFGFKKQNRAVDTGKRLTLVLENGEVRTYRRGKKNVRYETSDLILNMAVVDGKITSVVKGFRRGKGREEWIGKVRIKQFDNSLKLSVDLEITGKEGVERASYSIDIKKENKALKGNFSGTFSGRDVRGRVSGQYLTITPETPRDWNLIGLMPEKNRRISHVSNVGIAWVHLEGGVIYFGPDVEWGKSWAEAGSWKSDYVKKSWAERIPDGTHPWDPFAGGTRNYAGSGTGRLIFGCVLEHAAVLNDSVKMGRPDYKDGFGEDGFYMHKFGARIAAYGEDLFVANNKLPISRGRNFKYKQRTRRTFPNGKGGSMGFDSPRESVIFFDYNKTPGIEINKSLLGLTKNSPTGRAGAGFFSENVVVIDNYVYSNGHRGFDISGNWVVIAGNHNERQFLSEGWDPERIGGWELTLDGHLESSPGGNGAISDNLSRAFDLSGKNVWVHKNTYNNLGSAPGNDGEGILCQAHGGSQVYSWAVTYNNHDKGDGHSSYIGGWDVNIAGVLFGWNVLPGWIGSINVGKRNSEDAAFAGNRAGRGVKPMKGAQVGDPGGRLHPPRNVAAKWHDGGAVRITWKDKSANEAGFRIDRKIGEGRWFTVAYRPPRIEGHIENPQMWMDYLAPAGKKLSYRVVSINSKDNLEGASETVTVK